MRHDFSAARTRYKDIMPLRWRLRGDELRLSCFDAHLRYCLRHLAHYRRRCAKRQRPPVEMRADDALPRGRI